MSATQRYCYVIIAPELHSRSWMDGAWAGWEIGIRHEIAVGVSEQDEISRLTNVQFC